MLVKGIVLLSDCVRRDRDLGSDSRNIFQRGLKPAIPTHLNVLVVRKSLASWSNHQIVEAAFVSANLRPATVLSHLRERLGNITLGCEVGVEVFS